MVLLPLFRVYFSGIGLVGLNEFILKARFMELCLCDMDRISALSDTDISSTSMFSSSITIDVQFIS